MKVSGIIPVYRKEKYLRHCLGSLEKQSFGDFEVIVVNDEGNKGPAITRNFGVKRAKGGILVFVDADMTFEKDFIKDLIKPIELGYAKGTFSKEEYVANWDNAWSRCWNYNLNLPAKKRLPDNYPDHAPVFRAILKSEFQKTGGFTARGYDDDWTLSEKLGYRAQAVEGAIYYHYNPANLNEIFSQAKWRAKREYKLGLLGELGSLFVFTLPFSLVTGLGKAIRFQEPRFLAFKIIFDFGAFMGLLEKIFFHKYY